ncbi:transcription antitermination factor NusB [Desulfovibrio sp. OttesenSCG-928-F07]|nr:transcription antitermination factor NusB [Desulfovibrio sp. OttesenSCG-928-F07]
MPSNQRKNVQNRRLERARAFQVIYSLFFSPVDNAKTLARRYLHTLYAEPLPGDAFVTESEYVLEDDDSERPAALVIGYPQEEDRANIVVPDLDTETPEGFTWDLVLGVWQKQSELDTLITDFSQNWRTSRMGKVELALLRLAFFELAFRDDTPPKVIINEAIELSKQFGDDSSRGFVNGILDAAVKAVETGKIKRASLFWGK